MPKFIYTVRNQSGETKGGEIEAKEEKLAVEELRQQGFLITSIKQWEEKKNEIDIKILDRFFSGVSLKEKMIFARNLSIMVASGVTVSQAIHNLEEQTQNKKFKKILGEIYKGLQEGKAFSETLAGYPLIFSDLFVNMVRVGETGGNLEEVLNILAEQIEKENDLTRKVKGALIYPAVIIVAMIGIGILMLTYILPKITGVFNDMDVQLPATTKFVIGISDLLKKNSWAVVVFFIFGGIFLRLFLQTTIGKKTISYLLLVFPSVKNLVIKVNCARFARVYSSLLKSGVSVIEALEIVSNTLTNYYYKKAIKDSIAEVKKGTELSKIFASKRTVFPIIVSQMLEVGEETGKTEAVLLKLAEFYEEEVNQITKNLSSIIEPILMLLIGGSVGFFAVAMLQPMYSVLENIK